MVTMSDVAKLAGVSTMTVSNVVNGRDGVSDAVRARVLEVVAESGYRINVSARNLKSGRTGVIGLALPEIDSPYMGQLAMRVIAAADRRGYRVAVEQTHARAEGELAAVAASRNLMYDGLIMSLVDIRPGDPRLDGAGHPIVALGELPAGDAIDHVAMDNTEGVRTATRHLIERGCRRVCLVAGTPGRDTDMHVLRRVGYDLALADAGLEPDPSLIRPVGLLAAESGREVGHAIAADVRAGAADGIVAETDSLALGILRGLADEGVRVPDDVRLIGFDGIREGELSIPSLSSIEPDHEWIAESVVDLLVRRIEGRADAAVELIAPFRLVERESTA